MAKLIAVLALLAGGPGAGQPLPEERTVLLGRSAEGRPVKAVRVGEPSAARKALVVGTIHGDERAGLRVTRALRSLRGVRGVDIWVVHTVNPDGLARGRRQNARGVDLNRNFPYRWRRTGPRGNRYYAGRRPLSEPESRLVAHWIMRLRPSVTIWYHQPWRAVLLPCRGRAPLLQRYARLSGLRGQRCRAAGLTGTATGWQRRELPGSTPFVVELGAGQIGMRGARRHARAAAAVAAPRSR
jgi:murein peptide amidase A